MFTATSLADWLRLKLPRDAYFKDVDYAFDEGITSSAKLQRRSKQIASTKAFRKWNTSKTSAALCINGHADRDPPSATSFLSAMLAKTSGSEKVLVLTHFCARHTGLKTVQGHELEGPLLLLRALLAQILSVENLDRELLADIDENHVRAMTDGSFEQYLETFLDLLGKLTKMYKRILIIVDGIEYCHSDRQKEVKKVMRGLAKLAQGNPTASIKPIILAWSHSAIFGRVKGVEVLNMPDDPGDNESVFDNIGDVR